MRKSVLDRVLGWIAVCAGASAVVVPAARADWQVAPKNSHVQYQTYALFNEPQSALLHTGAGRLWTSLGGSFALVGDPDSAAHPQLVAIASLQLGIHPGADSRFALDALNTRLGAAYEFALNPLMRLSLGALYSSGNGISGGIDPFFAGNSAHDTRLFGRFVYDLGPYVRAGATLGVVMASAPALHPVTAQEFAEIHPWGGADDNRSPSPYVALGLEQEHTRAFGVQNNFHAQIGAYLGNHFSNDPKPTLRAVLGLYTGADPRIVYFRIADRKSTFGYVGLMFDF